MQDDAMSLVEHLGELRKRLIWIMVVLVITMISGFIAAKPILAFFKHVEPASNMNWNAFSPWDSVRVYMQCSFLFSLLVTSPYTLYHVWSFVKPGLLKSERKATVYYIPYTIVFFLTGLSFAYFIVFLLAYKFMTNLNNELGLTETYGIVHYFSFMFNILLAVSLLFELPVLIMFLTRIRLLNPSRLRKWRRYIYMLLMLISTMVTPPDVISVLIVAIPLFILYEISVIFSQSIYRKQLAKEGFELI